MLTYEDFSYFLQHSSTIRLIRSQNAPLVLGFFQYAFKSQEKITIPYEDLKAMLAHYLDDLNYKYPGRYPQTAIQYLDDWSADTHRFIRKYFEIGSDDPVVEMTYDTERALEWFESLKKRDFVGTESRFLMIFQGLKEIVDKTDIDPQKRIHELMNRKSELELEIENIQSFGVSSQLSSTQIKERFANIIEQARRLVSDFRMVEDNFRIIAKEVKENKLRFSKSKGQILGDVLDAKDSLDLSDQGRSFQTFWEFLMSDSKQKELQELTIKVLSNPVVKEVVQKNGFEQSQILRKLKNNLHGAGQKVQTSVHRLSEEIKSLLHEKNLLESKRVFELIEEIKGCALTLKEESLFRKEVTEVNHFKPDLNLPLERPLWSRPVNVEFNAGSIEKGDSSFSNENLSSLFNQFYIDKSALRKRVSELLIHREAISILEIISQHPIEKGLSEVVAYLEIASEDKHKISDKNKIQIHITSYQGEPSSIFKVRMSEIIFVRKGKMNAKPG